MSRTRAFFKTYDQRTGRKIRGIDAVYDGEIPNLLVERGEDDPPHPLSQPFAPPPDRVMLLGSRIVRDPPRPTNLVASGQTDFSSGVWALQYLTQTTGFDDPFGTTETAVKLLESSDTGSHHVDRTSLTITSGTTYALSAYVKPIGSRNVSLYLADSDFSNYGFVTFNGTSGVVDGGDDDDTTATIARTGVETLPLGWYRPWIALSLATTTARIRIATGSHAGDTAKGFYLWGVQLESGSWPSAYYSA